MIENQEDQVNIPIVGMPEDYVEFCLIKRDDNEWEVCYYIVKPDVINQRISDAILVMTNIIKPTIKECAEAIHTVISLGFFSCPVMGVGEIFDSELNDIDEVNWLEHLPTENTIITAPSNFKLH